MLELRSGGGNRTCTVTSVSVQSPCRSMTFADFDLLVQSLLNRITQTKIRNLLPHHPFFPCYRVKNFERLWTCRWFSTRICAKLPEMKTEFCSCLVFSSARRNVNVVKASYCCPTTYFTTDNPTFSIPISSADPSRIHGSRSHRI